MNVPIEVASRVDELIEAVPDGRRGEAGAASGGYYFFLLFMLLYFTVSLQIILCLNVITIDYRYSM